MAKNILPAKVKNYIVLRLAIRLKPSDISGKVKKRFGVEITRQGIHAYDPTKKAGKNLSPELKYMFSAVRELYDEEAAQRKQKAAINFETVIRFDRSGKAKTTTKST